MTPRRTAETTEELRASLVEHARRLVAREGPAKLTMRALAAEADCAVGLPYKVFADRQDLMIELVRASLAVFADFHATGQGPTLLESLLSDYLAAEQRAGRVSPDVDSSAFGFVLAGSIHHLVVMGDGYPRPTKPKLEQILDAICDRF